MAPAARSAVSHFGSVTFGAGAWIVFAGGCTVMRGAGVFGAAIFLAPFDHGCGFADPAAVTARHGVRVPARWGETVFGSNDDPEEDVGRDAVEPL